MNRKELFISVPELRARLDDPRVIVVDGSWHMPADHRDGRTEYLAGHIPRAVFFDLDGIADLTSPLPHMLPTPEAFAAAVGALGISEDSDIVVYDTVGLLSAARVRWTFRVMGARNVRILEGGLPAWTAAGLQLDAGWLRSSPATFVPRFDAAAVRSFDEVKALLGTTTQIVDARAANRFAGKEVEPRAGLRSGHMPGAVNLPWRELVADGHLVAGDTVARAFAARGVDLGRPIVTTCGSGVTAAVLALALETLGAADVALYDGSWTEWGGRPDAPVVTG